MTEISKADLLASIGQNMGHSDWFTLDQDRIDRFAEVTEDRQFIHTDPRAARDTAFGGTIAHGFLTLSMLSAMMAQGYPRMRDCHMGVNYGFDRVRFTAAVAAGSRVRAHFTLVAAEERSPGEVQLTNEVRVEIEGEARPALIALWLGRFYFGEGGTQQQEVKG